MKNIVLLGAPGSGKGTQSAKLVDLGYVHISTGNLLRSEIKKGSELGKKVESVLADGQLVSDDLVVELLKTNLDLKNKKYVFDGYPRNIEQAKTLDSLLKGTESLAVYLKLDTDVLVERITNRRMTADGLNIYNLKTNPPRVDGQCDKTGEILIQRPDDTEEVVRKRMKVFEETIEPILSFYAEGNKLEIIEAQNSVEDITNKLKQAIG